MCTIVAPMQTNIILNQAHETEKFYLKHVVTL